MKIETRHFKKKSKKDKGTCSAGKFQTLVEFETWFIEIEDEKMNDKRVCGTLYLVFISEIEKTNSFPFSPSPCFMKGQQMRKRYELVSRICIINANDLNNERRKN